jgi:hypothetical protein
LLSHVVEKNRGFTGKRGLDSGQIRVFLMIRGSNRWLLAGQSLQKCDAHPAKEIPRLRHGRTGGS